MLAFSIACFVIATLTLIMALCAYLDLNTRAAVNLCLATICFILAGAAFLSGLPTHADQCACECQSDMDALESQAK